MIGGSPEQVERQLEDWARQAERKAERYQEMGAAVSAVSATESSPDGMVKVTVNASGAVSALELTDRIREQSGPAVAAQIMQCVQRAQAKLAGQVAAAMQATIGGDEQSTIDTVVSSYEQRFPEPVSPSAGPDDGYKRIGELEDETPPPPVERRQPPRRPSDEDDDDFGGGSVLR